MAAASDEIGETPLVSCTDTTFVGLCKAAKLPVGVRLKLLAALQKLRGPEQVSVEQEVA